MPNCFSSTEIYYRLLRQIFYRRGHYQRALEEAVQTHFSQWPRAWNGKNPLHGGGSFTAMSPDERVRDRLLFTSLCSKN